MEMELGPDGKPCRACVSVEDMMKKARELAAKKKAGTTTEENKKPMAESEPLGSCGYPTTSKDHQHNCPVDKDELGRSTWNLLHTMSVYYPETPTEENKSTTKQFLENLSKTYPCDFCAKDLRKDLAQEPPNLLNRAEFANWMCRLHNKVNAKTGKPEFDCSKVFERWRDGWKDGSCDY